MNLHRKFKFTLTDEFLKNSNIQEKTVYEAIADTDRKVYNISCAEETVKYSNEEAQRYLLAGDWVLI